MLPPELPPLPALTRAEGELIDRYLQRLQAGEAYPIHPEVEKISGLVPADIEAESLYREYLMNKHR